MKSPYSAQKIWYIASAILLAVCAVLISAVFLINGLKSRELIFKSGVSFLESAVNSDLTKISDDIYLGLETLPSREIEINKKLGGLGKIQLEFEPGGVFSAEDLLQNKVDFSEKVGDRFASSQSKVTLFFGDIILGRLSVRVEWNQAVMKVSASETIFSIFPYLSFLFIVWSIVFYFINKKVISPLTEQKEMLVKTAAIAFTTQALAHDVRKPFSMLQSIIQIVDATEDSEEVREVLRATLPEVNQAMASVEGLIQDVMQIGSDAQVIQSDAAPEVLIEASLNELFRIYREVDVKISFDFNHRHMVSVDSIRVGRVFSNILGNAVQAMGEKGQLHIRTMEKTAFVEFTLSNEGSFIHLESLPKLFNTFFTSGKKGGTGLGLAIAKKIVEAHGGTIRCESQMSEKYPSGIVSFVFTLPVAAALVGPRMPSMPRSSREIQEAFARHRMTSGKKGESDPREGELEREIGRRLEKDSAQVTVLIVDDESVYRSGLVSLIARSENFIRRIKILHATTSVEAIALAREHAPELVIQDVDLGLKSACGLEVVRALRSEGFIGHICVHSNRFLVEDYKSAIGAGADTVVPKPIARAQFLKLILASLPEATPASMAQSKLETLAVAVVDDSITARTAWKMKISAWTRFSSYSGPKEFWMAYEADSLLLTTFDVIVTDYNFAPQDPSDGSIFASRLREEGYKGIILKASCEPDLGEQIESLFDANVGKMALSWSEFTSVIYAVRTRRKPAV